MASTDRVTVEPGNGSDESGCLVMATGDNTCRLIELLVALAAGFDATTS